MARSNRSAPVKWRSGPLRVLPVAAPDIGVACWDCASGAAVCSGSGCCATAICIGNATNAMLITNLPVAMQYSFPLFADFGRGVFWSLGEFSYLVQ